MTAEGPDDWAAEVTKWHERNKLTPKRKTERNEQGLLANEQPQRKDLAAHRGRADRGRGRDDLRRVPVVGPRIEGEDAA